MSMYEVFKNTDYLVLKRNYENSVLESDKLFWKMLLDLKDKSNNIDVGSKYENEICGELRWMYLNIEYMRIQDNFYGAKTVKEKEFWKKIIELKNKDIEIIMNTDEKKSANIKNKILCSCIKNMNDEEKERLCKDILRKINNLNKDKLISTIIKENPKIDKEDDREIAVSLLTIELMKDSDFDDKLISLIKEERSKRVYVTRKEDLNQYKNVNKAIRENRFKFLQTDDMNEEINEIKNKKNTKEKISIMKNFSKFVADKILSMK